MAKNRCGTHVGGGVLILAGLLGLFFHAFPGLLLVVSILAMAAGVLTLP